VQLPNADEAIIDREKLESYLLSTTHLVGRFKARFFRALGFASERWTELEAALRSDHLTQDAAVGESGPDGTSYTIRAMLRGPAGGSAFVVSVWFVRRNESRPRFVTAYPGDPK
jgi:hypothetical protein